MTHSVRLGLVPLYLMLCLLLGGASLAGYWANMLLQLMAIAIILWAALARRSAPMSSSGRQLVAITALALAVVGLQLIPLPPGLWTQFSGREQVAEAFRLLDRPLPWMPISLAPDETIASALWLLPALAVLAGILKLGGYKAGWIAWMLMFVMTVSVLIGALQLAGGAASPWYFYSVTNHGSSVGFFANSNHFSTLLVCTIPFLAALYASARRKGGSAQYASGLSIVLVGAFLVVVVGIVINTSLAAIALALPSAAASLVLLRSQRKKVPRWAGLALVSLVGLTVFGAFNSSFENNLTGASASLSAESRFNSFRNSMAATRDFFPLGSGLGTFASVYPMYEDQSSVTRVWMNHVHGDYIELALETGLVGLAVLALFLLWWCRRLLAIWSAEEPDHMARAASIASAVVLAHSLVDYPLRTAAISALFAACCALMADPRPKAKKVTSRPEDQARHLSAD